MNPFVQIIDLPGLKGKIPGQFGTGISNFVDSQNPRIDFSDVLEGKLSGELSLLFDKETDPVNTASVNPEKILSDKVGQLSIAGANGELSGSESDNSIINDRLIDPNKISSEQFLNANISTGINNNIEKSTEIITDVSPRLKIKAESPNITSSRSGFNPELKIDNQILSNLELAMAQSEIDNSEFKSDPAVLVEIDKELTSKNNVDLKTAGLMDKMAGLLNIKNVKLDKNSEANKTNKEPVKLTLPTKSYIKVSTVDNFRSANNEQFVKTDQNLIAADYGAISQDTKIENAEKITLNNFEVLTRTETEHKPVSMNETGQISNQIKMISGISPVTGNGAEKVEIIETKIEVTPAKFILPDEINGKNLKNNHTVMIRMEPDHLGPVRMTVTSHHDSMSARLVVDTPIAKATVESNLNNLIEQLDRQGIKVDSFSVSVSDGSVGHEAKENRYAGSNKLWRQNLKNYGNRVAIDKVVAQKGQNRLYIAASGVNCFA